MDILTEDLLLDISKDLGKHYYKRKEIETFYLVLGQYDKYEDDGMDSSAFVAYNKAIKHWRNSRSNECSVSMLKKLLFENNFKISPEVFFKENGKQNHENIFWNVPKRDIKFIGRSKELEKIDNHLNSQTGYAVITSCVGQGGIGKTSLIAHYIWANKGKYDTIAWFNSDSKDSLLEEEFLRFGVDKRITNEGNKDVKKIVYWFENNPGWLIVFDNVENSESIEKYTPNCDGKIIITSRNRSFFDSDNLIELENFSLEEVKLYLKKRLANIYNQTPEESIKMFAKELGFHPLSVAQATSYIFRDKISIDCYLKLKEEQKNILLSKIDSEMIQDDEFLKSYIFVLESFLLSVKKIYSKKKEGIVYLNKCAFLVPEKIPRSLFPRQILILLQEFSLITLEDETFFSIHRLVQESILFKLAGNSTGSEEDEMYGSTNTWDELTRTYDLLDSIYPLGKIFKRDLTLKRMLLPHYGSLFNHHLKKYPQNLTTEQRIKMTNIELDEVPKFAEIRLEVPIPGDIEIFETNPIADAKFALESFMSKEGFEEKEKAFQVALTTFQKHLIYDDVTIAETSLLLSFLYIKQFYTDRLVNHHLENAKKFYDSGIKGKMNEKEMAFTFFQEAKGYFHGYSNCKKEQLEAYMEAYASQLEICQRDSSEELPLARWETHSTGISTNNAVSAGRFIFPGFAHYQGPGFDSEKIELEILVGRGKTNGNILPGKFLRFPTFDSFQCSYNGEEVKLYEFEILRMEPGTFKWVLSSNGKSVRKAIVGGEDSNGEILYIGRVYVTTEGNPTEPSIGKVQASKQGCVVPLWNKEYLFPDYEILVGI